MKPYYQSASGDVTVYCGRWEDCVGAGCVEVASVGLVHADPPYGIRLDTKARGKSRREVGLGGQYIPKRSWAPVIGDDAPFDPAPILALNRPTVIWGGNHFASRLPDSPSWIWWDKREEQPEIDNADGELAWSNLGGPARRFAFLWRGLTRRSEGMGGATGSSPHLHPTQKPIALSTYIFTRARLKPGALVFVPFLGSGPDLPAALAMGLRVVACDVSEECCRVAVGARLGAVAQGRAAEPVGPLFSRKP